MNFLPFSVRLAIIRWYRSPQSGDLNSDTANSHRIAQERLSITPEPETEEEVLRARQLRPIIRRRSRDTTPLLSPVPEASPSGSTSSRQRSTPRETRKTTSSTQPPTPTSTPIEPTVNINEILEQYDTVSENSPYDLIAPSE